MMGFGGGAGTPNAPFGSSNSSHQQQSSGFGASSGFGNNAAPAPASNANASFGATQSYGGFGGAQSPPSSHPFGGGSGGSGSGFGNHASPPPTQFGQQQANAQTPAPAAPGMTFGSSSNMGPFGASNSNTQATTSGGFGQSSTQASTSGGFGQSSFGASAPSTGGGFGGSSATTFGGSSGFSAPAPSVGFDTSSYGSSSGGGGGGGGFGASPAPYRSAPATQSSSFSNPPNPFGAASTAPASAVTFGTSSNVVATSGFGNASDSDMFTGSPIPYGFNSPMHQHSDSDDMGGGDDHRGGQQQSASNLPFGTPAATTTSTWGAPSSTFGGQSSSTFGGQSSLSPIPETGQHSTPSGGQSPVMANANVPAAQSAEDDKLATLKARIEEKKRRLEESKRKKEAAAREAANASTPSPPVPAEVSAKPLSAAAPAFAPGPAFAGSTAAPAFAPGPAFAGSSSAAEPQSLAEKNAVRFSSNNNSESIRSHMPADLRAMAEGIKTQALSHRTDEREDPQVLKNAVSLIGTCMHMCPDEELLRREREGDVQLLEIPQPGKLHPADWTLRNTVVKRFRRSAADYKLDVPDWVRPPDVLEKVCSYLEEWVMERDRQGPDPRFPQGITPPPLDVYQFIWDRTRMVRKDFILQNFVGTGGSCDARAVRCHERIARWHAMCEHQLSHISQFVVAQSQQNIQELGQTMKTLNQYYDDSMNRSLVEVPDKDGNETRTDPSAFLGCASDVIQGNSPVDFDGTPLVNDQSSPALPLRLINGNCTSTPHHGTAEPEMRGLYILLTMNNDGGMEVLKYASQLFRERPEIYHGKPIQLALSIYKAKKEYNYARFFSILRAPSTPYLFACIMFKHVELMRKVAIKIMHKTFGGKSKEANEAIYDAYPLKDLIRLLCFEDADEARTACQHYNITVKNMKVKTSRGTNVEEIIFWKQTAFREPKDPEKGTLIPLSPRKMVKNIESKLGGATRLAVCRGEVSGEGAFLTNISPRKGATFSSPQAAVDNSALAEERAAAIRSMQQREQERRQIDVRKSEEQENERLREEELMREKAEQEQLAEAARMRNIEMQERQKLELQRQQEKEEQERILREQQKQELEQRRIEMERESARKKAEKEQKRKLELERQEAMRREQERMLREQEEQRRREEENKRREEEMAKRLQAEEEAKRVRHAEEAKKLAELRHREEIERKQRDTVVRREEFEWRAKIDAARKHLLWLRWEQQLPRNLRMMEPIEASLRRIDPTVKSGALVEAFADRVTLPPNSSPTYQPSEERRIDVRRVVERILGKEPDEINLASSVAMHGASGTLNDDSANRRGNEKTTLLFKIAVILPVSTNDHVQNLCNLIHTWIDSRLDYDLIRSEYSGDCEIRVVTVDGTLDENLETCDAVMAVICPPWSKPNEGISTVSESLSNMASRIGNSVPRTVLVLREDFEQSFIESRTQSIADIFLGSFGSVSVSSNTDLTEGATEDALLSSCETLTSMLVNETLLGLERISVGRLALKCISDVIWQDRLLERRDDILEHARAALHCMVDEFESLRSDCKNDWQWPAVDFAVDGSTIPDYFGVGEHLPLDWISKLSRAELGPAVSKILSALAGPLPEVVERLLLCAPYDVKQKIESLLDRRLFRRCLQSALLWNESNQAKQAKHFLYFPRGVLEDTVRSTVVRLQGRFVGLLEPSATELIADNQTFGSDRAIEGPPLPLPLVATRAWENSSVLPISKRPRSEPSDPIVDRSLDTRRQETIPPKRQRRDLQTSFQPYSRDQKESSAFSRKLDALLSGSNVQDMMIGDETLSALLRGAPSLARPTKDYLNN